MTGDSEAWETLFQSTYNKVAWPRQLDPAYLAELGSFHPGGIFNFTVAGAGVGAHEHVHREECRMQRPGFIGIEDKILHNQAAVRRQCLTGTAEDVPILLL